MFCENAEMCEKLPLWKRDSRFREPIDLADWPVFLLRADGNTGNLPSVITSGLPESSFPEAEKCPEMVLAAASQLSITVSPLVKRTCSARRAF